jgi:outer membrane protein assembly factor BamB
MDSTIREDTFMKRLQVAGLVALLTLGAATGVQAVPPSQIYSTPSLPSPEALRRLNLTMAWFRYIPTQGPRDGFLTAQLIGRDLLVQTRSGTVTRLDAETGRVYWRTPVGMPFQAYRALEANTRSVFVGNSNYLFALDRETGSVQWRTRLPAGLSAAPIAGELGLYLPTSGGLLYAFALPVTDFLASRESKGGIAGAVSPLITSSSVEREGGFGPQPSFFWSEETGIRLEFSPLQTTEVILCVSPTGDAVAYAKVPKVARGGTQLYRFQTELTISVPPGQFGDTAYIGGRDANLYALNMTTGRLRWRYTAGTPISRPPVALEEDVYITTEKEGLIRVDRDSGEAVWRVSSGRRILSSNPEADRFLAANDRFVYATDASNRLLVLDRRRGTLLSRLDTVAFRFPIPNRVTDRLYLASNDGLVVCLRDRDVETPIRHRRVEEEIGDTLRKTLATLVTEPAQLKDTLRNFIAGLRTKYKMKIEVVENAFKEIGVAGVLEKEILVPKLENRPLSELLTQVLAQVGATYETVEDTLLILPGKPRPK